MPQINPKNVDMSVNCNVTNIPAKMKGILGAILAKDKGDCLETGCFVSVVVTNESLNHLFTNSSIFPPFFISSRTGLNCFNSGEPFGKAIAEPSSSELLGIKLNSKSELLAINPLATVSSIIAASILPDLSS